MHCAGCNIQPIDRLPEVVRLTICAPSVAGAGVLPRELATGRLVPIRLDGGEVRAIQCADG